ncbi:nucleotidyltransferase family protein [Actinocatenispora rupis]|uniref:MobA-like NTP transferase domain-containing protein n=1 Tax=Actinocatenispora rupis TaxID=519421 RepID=A0A8J3J3Q3_9ACTN|nr:nucleotidyltransferase family protein [Actinocatenispora rupis]GID11545.1 hypothetical protein Aru02nite_24340 [Actinocatenispora rupis]
MPEVRVTGVVLAAGGSARLGAPKQLLPYRGATLLAATLDVARRCGFAQILVALGGAADEIHARVDLTGAQVVRNPDFGDGCGSSISSAIAAVDPDSAGVVLLLGDQPGVEPFVVRRLVHAATAPGSGGTQPIPVAPVPGAAVRVPTGTPIGVCRYDDGLGHPFWFGRRTFGALAALHGDKAVWKLLHSGRYDVVELPVTGPVPIDVDTLDDYRALLAADAASGP